MWLDADPKRTGNLDGVSIALRHRPPDGVSELHLRIRGNVIEELGWGGVDGVRVRFGLGEQHRGLMRIEPWSGDGVKRALRSEYTHQVRAASVVLSARWISEHLPTKTEEVKWKKVDGALEIALPAWAIRPENDIVKASKR